VIASSLLEGNEGRSLSSSRILSLLGSVAYLYRARLICLLGVKGVDSSLEEAEVMIEAIVDYIQKQGCRVMVFEGILVLALSRGGWEYRRGWAISRVELAYRPLSTFYEEADYLIESLLHAAHNFQFEERTHDERSVPDLWGV
jgi:hypothetical protein